MQLTVRIEGVGNVKLLPAPIIDIADVTASPAGETIVVDSTDLLIRGSKTFKFLLTPRRDGDVPLGSIRYAYFNPVRGAYEEIIAPLGSLRVAAGATVAEDDKEARMPALPLRPWAAAGIADVTERWWYRLTFLGLGLPWLALVLRRVWRALPKREPRERRQRRRGLLQEMPSTSANLRRVYIERLAPLVQLRSDQPFAVPDVVRRLRRAGVTPDAAEAAGALLMRLDLLTFSRSNAISEDLLQTLSREADAVHDQLRAELSSKVRARLQAAVRSIALVATLAGVADAQPREFVRGVDAYQKERYTAAAVEFARAATAAPLSAVVWENLGAAHWMRADTAGAIVAWQRSARLAPRNGELVERLRQLSPAADVRTAIIPLTPNSAWLLLLLVTVLLSVSGAAWRWSNRHISNGALLGATTAVAVCAILAVLAQRAANADGLVVIRRDVALRTEPVLAGEARARARGGEVAIVTDTSASWLLVTVPGGRSGWVEVDALRSLAIGDAKEVAAAESQLASESPVP